MYLVSTPSTSKKDEIWDCRTLYTRDTGIASNVLGFFFAIADFFLFFFPSFLSPSFPSSLSPIFPSFILLSWFVFVLRVRTLKLEVKISTGGTITSVSQCKTLIHFELSLWQISIIHISKSTLISHSRPDLSGPERN